MFYGKVVNIKSNDVSSNAVYIGRSGKGSSGYFGNPFTISDTMDRATCIERFREYAQSRMYHDPEYREAVRNLAGKNLACFCAPAPCHGDVLLDLAWRDLMVDVAEIVTTTEQELTADQMWEERQLQMAEFGF